MSTTLVALAGAGVAVGLPIAKKAADFAEKLLGKPCEVAGDMLADQLYYWQWCNRIRVLERAEKLLAAEGIEPTVVPPDFLLPLLDRAGYTADDALANMWAHLLASGVVGDGARHPGNFAVISQLSARDAVLLQLVFSKPLVTNHLRYFEWQLGDDLPEGFDEPNDLVISAINLESLSLIRPINNLWKLVPVPPSRRDEATGQRINVNLSLRGEMFCMAVLGEEKAGPYVE